MTLNGAIMQLVEMRENRMMPDLFKPYFDKVIETISECVEPSEIPHWIPCKERMPETDGKYLVSVNLDGHEYCDEDYWHRDSWNMYYKKSITAWMPKIEPYREGAQE